MVDRVKTIEDNQSSFLSTDSQEILLLASLSLQAVNEDASHLIHLTEKKKMG